MLKYLIDDFDLFQNLNPKLTVFKGASIFFHSTPSSSEMCFKLEQNSVQAELIQLNELNHVSVVPKEQI